MSVLGPSPSQTVGPYFVLALGGEGQNVLVHDGVPGERIRVEGRVLDGDRKPIEDALIELWQANAVGRYHHPRDTRRGLALDAGFTGFGRAATEFGTGQYAFDTVRPGCVPGADGALQAPHLNLIVQARGMLLASHTRVYFSDRAADNERDAVLRRVPSTRRSTLIAELVEAREPSASTRPGCAADPARVFRFDVRYQGDDETVFFEF